MAARTIPSSEVGRPGFVWAAPAIGFFGLFALLPMLAVVYLSFTRYNGIQAPTWLGLANWRHLASDPIIGQTLRLSVMMTALSWLLQTCVALPLGVYVAGKGRTRSVLAAIFFVPLLMSGAAIALLWSTLFDPNFGLAAKVGPLLGVEDGNFIGDPTLAFYAVLVVIAWQFIPFHTLLYQGATRAIPGSLYEAATIDGASRLQQFWSITIPQLRDTIITSGVLMVVGSLTYFEVILILTGGGPGTSTRVLPLHMYITGFRGFNMGYASVLAVLLLVIGTLLSLLVTHVTGYRKMTSQREGM
ncbi:MAG TPA: sugar ABC transporter permease [Nocardioidaceae bacterium]